MTARQQPQNPQPGIAIRGGKQYTSVAFTWRAVPTPDVGYLSGVSCLNPASCIAVGSASNSGFGQADSEAWNGTAWRALDTPNFGGPFSILSSVSCTAVTRCMAVGTWKALTVPFGPNLSAISCVTASWCMAVEANYGSIATAFAAQWNGSTWRKLTVVSPGTIETDLSGVSCASTAACLAVGQYIIGNPDSHEEPQLRLDETWNGSSWQIPQSPGYLMQLSSGGTANFNVSWYGSERGALAGGVTAVGIAADAATGGYWILNSTGGVANYHAPWYGSLAGQRAPAPAGIAGL